MPMLFNGYDLAAIICEQEVRIVMAEMVINKMITSGRTIQISQDEISDMREEVIDSVKKKYPGLWPE